MTIEEILNGILKREGSEFTNHPDDSGGPTKFGITLATLRECRRDVVPIEHLMALTEEEARSVYRWRYIHRPQFDLLMVHSHSIGVEVIDTGVNMGPAVAAIFLQRALNCFNLRGVKYPDLKIDGDCGSRTRAALAAFLDWRGTQGERVLVAALNCLQGERYISLAEGRPKDESFVYGWIKNRVLGE